MKMGIFGLVVFLTVVASGEALAESTNFVSKSTRRSDNDFVSKESSSSGATSVPSSSAAPVKSRESAAVTDQLALEAEKRKELDNSEWAITVVERGSANSQAEKDTLDFRGGQVGLASFEKMGYGPAGYSLVVDKSNDGGTWESYQKGSEGSLTLRGDWTGEVMNGIAVIQTGSDKDIKMKTYYFSSRQKTALAEAKPEEAASAKASAAETAASATETINKVLVSKKVELPQESALAEGMVPNSQEKKS